MATSEQIDEARRDVHLGEVAVDKLRDKLERCRRDVDATEQAVADTEAQLAKDRARLDSFGNHVHAQAGVATGSGDAAL